MPSVRFCQNRVILPRLPFIGTAQEKRTIDATEEHPEMAFVPILEDVWVYQRIDEGSKETPNEVYTSWGIRLGIFM